MNEDDRLHLAHLVELLRRHCQAGRRIGSPAELVNLLRNRGNTSVENLWLISVNGSKEILSVKHIGMGIVDAVLVHPREIFASAICERAAAILLAHNHPSGNLKPSSCDREVTQRVFEVGRLVGIPLLDHVIFSDDSYYSFVEHGQIPSADRRAIK